MSQKIYLFICLFSNIYIFFDELIKQDFSIYHIIWGSISLLLSYILCYFIFQKFKNLKLGNPKYFFKINYSRFNYFMFIYGIIMIIYSLIYDDFKAGGMVVTSSSIFASLFPYNGIFYYYYCICRKDYKKSVYINTGLFFFYNLINGYVGIIMILFFYELHFLFQNKTISSFKCFIYSFGSTILGIFAYSFFSPIKWSIRHGADFKVLSLSDSADKLLSRISHLHTTIFSIENIDFIKESYLQQEIALMEFKTYFRPIIPSFIFKNKLFHSVGNIIHNKLYNYTRTNGTDSPSILTYLNVLGKCDFISFLGWLILTVFSLLMIKYICNKLQSYEGQFDMLFFWLIVATLSICGNLETLFSNSYIKIVFFIPVLFFMKIIKLKKRENIDV